MKKPSTKNIKKRMVSLSQADSYDELSEFWDNHSIADCWDKTEKVDFEMSSDLRHKHVVAIDSELLNSAHKMAYTRGISTESMINIMLEKTIHNFA